MVWWHSAQVFFGVAILLFGITINVARHKERVRTFIERYILGEGNLFDPNAEYAPAVNFAGWKSFITGVAIAAPLPVYWDTALVVLGALVVLWVGTRVRREYRKLKEEQASRTDEHGLDTA